MIIVVTIGLATALMNVIFAKDWHGRLGWATASVLFASELSEYLIGG